MRVAHLVHGHPALDDAAGGTERYAAALAAHRGDLVVVADDGSGVREHGAGLVVVGAGRPQARRFEHSWRAGRFTAGLAEVLDRHRTDLLHVHHLATAGLDWLDGLGHRRLVVTLHDYHLACVRGQLVDRDLKPCEGPEPARCASCVREHLHARRWMHLAGRVAGRLGVRGRARDAVAKVPARPADAARLAARAAAARALLHRADLVLSPSRHLAARVRATGLAGAIDRVDLPLVSPIAAAPDPAPGPVRFLFVGSLIPTKGPQVLLSAHDRARAGSVTFWGPRVPYDGRPGWAEDLVDRIGKVPGARWAGTFGDEERSRVYADADVLVVPSIWEENSPLVVREAQAAGLRVVASRVGGLPELVTEGVLVPPGHPGALSHALRAEALRGRGRRPPIERPMATHAEEMEERYQRCGARVDTAEGGR